LLDLVRTGCIHLDRVEVLVLDEADRMLDMGFIHDIRTIVAKLPAKRQTLLFSATMPQSIAELASQMLRDPAKVAVTPVASTVQRIEQRVIHLDRMAKPALLAQVLRRESVDRALVFVRTKHGADKVSRALIRSGIAAEAIHGNKSQNQRERVLTAFRGGSLRTLIATDIAARGIDVEGISHVINYDLPAVPETYVHRIGRTARAGADGVAISFCSADEAPLLRAIEKLIRTSIPTTGVRLCAAPTQPSKRIPERGRQRRRRARPGANGQSATPPKELATVAFLHRAPEPRTLSAMSDARREPR
jgi:superfamily II DNA/RNA helicase